MVSFCSLKISLWNACTVLVFFIAGLLFVALRARRPLGAYRIPLETGLLIPSGNRVLGMWPKPTRTRKQVSNQMTLRALARRLKDSSLRSLPQRESAMMRDHGDKELGF